MVFEVLKVVLRKLYLPFFTGFIFVFNPSPQDVVISTVAKLGAIILVVVSMYVVADRSKYFWAIVLGVFFGALGALVGYFVGAVFYDYVL